MMMKQKILMVKFMMKMTRNGTGMVQEPFLLMILVVLKDLLILRICMLRRVSSLIRRITQPIKRTIKLERNLTLLIRKVNIQLTLQKLKPLKTKRIHFQLLRSL